MKQIRKKHNPRFKAKVAVAALKEKGMDDMLVVAGSIIPEADRAVLQEMGVAAIFGPGTNTTEIAGFIRGATVPA